MEDEEAAGDHGGFIAADGEEAALGEKATAWRTSEIVLCKVAGLWLESVVFGEAWGEEGDAGVEEVSEGTFFFPKEIAGKGEGFAPHIVGEFGLPVGEVFEVGLEVFQMVEVEPLGDEAHGLLDGPGIAKHAFDLFFERGRIVEGVIFGGVEEGLVGWAAPDEVAEPGGELVGVGRTFAFDAVQEAR